MEIKKEITIFDRHLVVSSIGEVFTLKNGTLYRLRQSVTHNGYLSVGVFCNGISRSFRVHRLVAMAFLDNTNSCPCVNHKNGIKTDNRLENLEWVSHLENSRHYRILSEKVSEFGLGVSMSAFVASKIYEDRIISKRILSESRKKIKIIRIPIDSKFWFKNPKMIAANIEIEKNYAKEIEKMKKNDPFSQSSSTVSVIQSKIGIESKPIPDTSEAYWLTKSGELFHVTIKAVYHCGQWQKRVTTKQLMPRRCSRRTVRFAFTQAGKRRDVALSTLMLEVFNS